MRPWSIQLRGVSDGAKVSGMMVAATSTPVWAVRPEKKPALGRGTVMAISVSLCARRNDVFTRSVPLKALTPPVSFDAWKVGELPPGQDRLPANDAA